MTPWPVPLVTNQTATKVCLAWASERGLLGRHSRVPMLLQRRWSDDGGAIYFASADGGPIKVGWSGRVLERLRQLRSDDGRACIPRVVICPAYYCDEWELHGVLKPFRIAGPHLEWYEPNSPVGELQQRLVAAAEGSLRFRFKEPRVRLARTERLAT